MKLYLSLFSLFFCSISYCQTEFKDHGNGLIYSNQVMSKLSQIVDSENQQFRVCELTKTYVSQIQALCTVYKVDSKYNNAIIKDAKAGISEERFKTKYKINSTANELAVKREYTDYQEKERVNIKLFPSSEAIYYDKKDFSKHHIKNWLIQDNNQETFKVLYFKTPLKAKNIPDNYGRMLLYSECMIDTTTTIHPKTAKEYGRWDEEEDAPKHQKQLEDYIIKKLGKNPPVFNENEANPDKDYSDYWEDLKAYENEKNALIKHTLIDF